MPRQPKPYWKSDRKRWVCTINGKRITLGEDREESFEEFHRLMAERENISAKLTTLDDLSQVYLTWVEANRKEGTYRLLKHYLKSFINHVGRRLKVSSLRQHHLTEWTNNDSWNSTTRNDAIRAVQRMLNWAVDEGYLHRSPIPKIKKPPRKRREIVYTPEQWSQVKRHAKGPLIPFLDFLWATGCRPKEARTLEARHIHNDLIIFPPDESKGERDSRMIILAERAKAIVDQQKKIHPNGCIFRNSVGKQWTKDAVRLRLQRISKKVGFRVIAYGARHSYTTNALIRSVDPISLAHLLGHRSTREVASTYSHLAKNMAFLREQAKNAAGYPKSSGLS